MADKKYCFLPILGHWGLFGHFLTDIGSMPQLKNTSLSGGWQSNFIFWSPSVPHVVVQSDQPMKEFIEKNDKCDLWK